MKRTAIYCRFSSVTQAGGVSIETQLEHCRKLAGNKPIEYIDRAQSGRTMQRTAFLKLMDDAEKHLFDKLLVYKWDRFGRNSETHMVINDLEDMGITVESVTEGSDFLARGVGLLVGEDFSKKLSQRVKDSMRVRFKQNRTFMGGTIPYGMRVVKNASGLSHLEIDPAEAVVVKEVFRLYLKESLGAKRLARRLDEQGCQPRKGGKWGWTTVNRMLSNRMYTGYIFYGKTSEKLHRPTGKVKKVPNAEFLTHQVEELRIISNADFERVQTILAGKTTRDYRLPRDVRPFSKRVWCPCCGSVLYARHTGLHHKTVTYFLVCGRRDLHKTSAEDGGCSNPNRPRERDLISWVQAGIGKVLSHKDRIITRALELATKSLDQSDGRREMLLKERAAIETQIERFGRLMRNPKLSDDEMRGYSMQLGRLDRERNEIVTNLDKVAGETNFDKRALIREIEGAMMEAKENLLAMVGPATFNAAVERFVGPILALPDGSVVRRDDWDGVLPVLPHTVGPKPVAPPMVPPVSACGRSRD